MRANITPASCGLKCLINAVTGEVDTGTRVFGLASNQQFSPQQESAGIKPETAGDDGPDADTSTPPVYRSQRPEKEVRMPCACSRPTRCKAVNEFAQPLPLHTEVPFTLSVPTFRGLVAEVFVASPLSDGEERGNAVDKCDGLLFFRSSFFDERKIVVLRSDASDKTAKQNESDDHFR
jgi:hypothetical protein